MSVGTAEKAEPVRRKKRSVWHWLLYGLLLIGLIIGVIAAYLWLNRYSLLEQAAEDLLLEQGIEAELSIESVSKTQAVLKTVRFSDGTLEFFSADKVIADYAWREALKGHVNKLQLIRPKASMTLDEKGRIIDSWLPPASEDGSGKIVLPPEGIIIKDGTFTIGSPYGTAKAGVEATIFAADNFLAKVDIAPSDFSYAEWQVSGGGKVDVAIQGDNPKLDVDVALSKLSHPAVDMSAVKIKGNFVPEIIGQSRRVEGDLRLTFDHLDMAQIRSGDGDIEWRGMAEHDAARTHRLALKGAWSADLSAVNLPDPIRRRDLAKTLSLSNALSNAPIAQNFSADVTANVLALLELSDVKAAGELNLDAAGLQINLLTPADIKSEKTTLILRQTDWAPVYNYNRADSQLRLAFHAGLTQPAGLAFNEAEMVATTPNGWSLTGVDKFVASVSTTKTWRSRGMDGQAARLAPFAAKAIYTADTTPRRLILSGGVDYDGTVPGGYVTGLKTGGRMAMDMQDAGLSVRFKPEGDEPISIDRVTTPTEWRAENVTAQLRSNAPIFRRRASTFFMNAELADVSFVAIDKTERKHLDMSFSEMEIEGELKGGAQSWDIFGRTARITSEDMPGPGTVITTPETRIQVQRESESTPLQFYMAAPAADAKTQLVNATNIRIEAAGQPDKYTLRYSPGESGKGRVKFVGDAIPRLPMTGSVDFAGGAFTGTATTTLPLADDTPIDIAYRFQDGAGTADVIIPELRFMPKGLQPQYLVSALRGKIAEVQGLVEAKIKLNFAAGQPLQSSGSAKIIDMNFGTLPGPLTGVNTEMQFSNMFPLQSQGRQTLTVNKFDPGFPLEDGVIEFEMIPDGVKVYSARWPLGDGFFSLDPFEWLYSNEVNRVVMRIENVSIGEFLKDVGDGALTATGNLEGTLPIVLSGVDVKVENGELLVKEGGRIQYQSKQLNSISELDGTDEKAVAAIRQGNYRDAAFEALKDFEYDELRVTIDGPLDGAMGVFLKFDGKNKDVLGGQPFRFDIGLEGELLNILRSFNSNAQIKSELARRGLTKEEEMPDFTQ